MEILEQSPPMPLDSKKLEESNKKLKGQSYTNSYRNLLISYSLVGLILGQLLWLLSPSPLPLGPIIGLLLGLAYAYYQAHYSLGDLTDWQIALLEKEDIVSPFNIDQVEPDSYDVLLGNKYTRLKKGGVEETLEAQEIIIQPNECLLAHTIESFSLPKNIKGTLQGKSSWARLSLFVECAGLFDKGFKGTAVLELFNASPNPILLKYGDRIAQMSFHRTLPAAIPYGNKLRTNHYQGQQGAQSSWLTKRNRIII